MFKKLRNIVLMFRNIFVVIFYLEYEQDNYCNDIIEWHVIWMDKKDNILGHLDALFFDQELLQELKHGNNKIDRENRIFYVT